MNYLSYDFENQGFYSKNPLKIEDIKFDLDIMNLIVNQNGLYGQAL